MERVLEKRKFLKMFWPVLIEQSLSVIVGIVAALMLRSISSAAMAGVGLLSVVNILMLNAFSAIASGVNVVVSQCVGAKNRTLAGKVTGQSILLCLYLSIFMGTFMAVLSRPVLGLLFPGAEEPVLNAAAIYLRYMAGSLPFQALFALTAGILRANGNTKTPMKSSLIGNASFLTVSALGIFVFNLDVHGAGLGFAFSRIVMASIIVIQLYKIRKKLEIPPLGLKLDYSILRRVFKIAIPAGIDSLIYNIGKLILNMFKSGMGTVVLEANAIVVNLANFVYMPFVILSTITVPLVGQSWGAGEFRQARRRAFILVLVSSTMQIALLAIFLLLPGHGINFFRPGEETFTVARAAFLICLFAAVPVGALGYVLPQALRASGDVKYVMYVSMTSMIVMRIFMSWVLGVHFDMRLTGIWIASILDWSTRAVFFTARAINLHKRGKQVI